MVRHALTSRRLYLHICLKLDNLVDSFEIMVADVNQNVALLYYCSFFLVRLKVRSLHFHACCADVGGVGGAGDVGEVDEEEMPYLKWQKMNRVMRRRTQDAMLNVK